MAAERVSGHRAVFVRNPDYIARSEPTNGLAGSRVFKVDRVEWTFLPDPTTAANGLATDYPISWSGRHDYLYADAAIQFQRLYDSFGSDRCVWGSDMPNVERFWTYRQSLTYAWDYFTGSVRFRASVGSLAGKRLAG